MPDKMATAVEVESPVKQCITVLEKKIRNLEKRKGKLDCYRKTSENDELNKDQKEAIAKYDVVLQNIEFAKELQKHFADISVDSEKTQKKHSKREKMERHQQELLRLQDLLKLNSVLTALGNDNVREDFRAGKNMSLVLKDENLQQLDDFYQLLFPTRETDQSNQNFDEQLVAASEHLVSYLDHQDKKVLNTTYKELHELINCINSCGYFDKNDNSAVVNRTEVQQTAESTPEIERYEEQTAVGAESVETEERADESVEPMNNVCGSGASTEAINDLAHVPTQPDPYHSTHWSHSPVLVTQQPATVMVPSATPALSVAAMTTAQVDRPPAGRFSDTAYYSGFAKQRPLQEIVSSLQGSYNFLQESQIDLEGHTQGQSSSDGVYNSYENQATAGQSFSAPQQPTLGPQSAIDQSAALHASQPHFDHDAPQSGGAIYHPQGATTGAYGVQGLHNVYSHHPMSHEPGFDPNFGQMDKTQYNFIDQQTYVLAQMTPSNDPPSHVSNIQNVVSTTGPQPIPLPSQAIHGQSLTEQGFTSPQQTPPEAMSEAMAKKQFLNPNADIFRSHFDEPSVAAAGGDQMKPDIPAPSSSGVVSDGQQVLRTFAQTASANFQAGGIGRSFAPNFAAGGPRGSGAPRGAVRGGREATLNNGGVQSGARGGGPSNTGRGGGVVPNMGSNAPRGGGGARGGGGLPRGGSNNNTRGRGFGRNSQHHEQATHA